MITVGELLEILELKNPDLYVYVWCDNLHPVNHVSVELNDGDDTPPYDNNKYIVYIE